LQRLAHLEEAFKKLADAGYEPTSDATGETFSEGSYNCIAWAAEDVHHKFWWPLPGGYWPFCKREVTVVAFVNTFNCLGYIRCKRFRRELGFDKLALYAIHKSRWPTPIPADLREFEDWTPTHMARQLKDGTWTSKCGPNEDIMHLTLDALESYGWRADAYGCPVLFMKRHVLISWIVQCLQRAYLKYEPLRNRVRCWLASRASDEPED
jgi:hypothetical protein